MPVRPLAAVAPGEGLEEIVIHGHRVRFRQAGSGPVLLLVHGITGSSANWRRVIGPLAENYTVIAPDLSGHGESAKPKGDYSLGSFASGLRDLLVALGHERATIVGHSLGGGIAMQFAYQFPERLDRMVLVSSGGLGREVSILIRSATLPGAEIVLPLLVAEPIRNAVAGIRKLFGLVGLKPGSDLEEVARGFASLHDIETRQAFIHTVRGIIELTGQRVSATDRLYLAAEVPTLIIWGERDPVIPSHHGESAAASMPGSRLELFSKSGHFPQLDDPIRFIRVLSDFLESTEPAEIDHDRMRRLILERTAATS